MALTSDDVVATKNDEVNSSSSDDKLPVEQEELNDIDTSITEPNYDEQKEASIESEEPISIPVFEEKDLPKKRQEQFKSRSVSFAPTVEEYEIPSRYDPSYISLHQPTDYIDALVESYKLQTLPTLFPFHEEKKYIPKTNHTRLNRNWREHRIRHFMNKLEELSLWDREEELKFSQAQFLREQKLEQIQDRQRNQDLCLNLMRQRHESEMESAILLDRIAHGINEENTNATIAQTMNLASPANILAYNLPNPPYNLKRRVQQDQEKTPIYKTPIGRYRQFETNMNNKMEKINEKIKPDWKIMRAYSPHRTSIPPNVSPLFSETYAALLSIPDSYSSNRHDQYHHYGIPSYSQHASSPDYETRIKARSNRDVRVPFNEEQDDNNDEDDYNHIRSNSNLSRRQINFGPSTTLSLYDSSSLPHTSREYSLIHSRQPLSNSIHQRTLNDDLNAAFETNKTILRNNTDLSNGVSIQNRSSSVPANKRVTFIDHENTNNNNDNDEENYNYSKSSRIIYQPDSIYHSSTL